MLDFGKQLSLKGEAILSVKGVGDHDLITIKNICCIKNFKTVNYYFLLMISEKGGKVNFYSFQK